MPRAKKPTTGRIIPAPIAEMPYKLLGATTVGAAAKILYLALRHNARALGEDFWHAQTYPMIPINSTYLLEDTALGREEFRRALNELEQQGWVAIIRPNEHKTTATIDGQTYTFRVERDNSDRDPTRPRSTPPSFYVLLAG